MGGGTGAGAALRDADAGSSFPHWVAWGSLAAALLLFFGNTVPAVRERTALAATENELKTLRHRYDDALLLARNATPVGDADDLQSLLVAIDAIGWTPEELLRHYRDNDSRRSGDAAAERGVSRNADGDREWQAGRAPDPPMGGDLPTRR
jgi:hypothetical protein